MEVMGTIPPFYAIILLESLVVFAGTFLLWILFLKDKRVKHETKPKVAGSHADSELSLDDAKNGRKSEPGCSARSAVEASCCLQNLELEEESVGSKKRLDARKSGTGFCCQQNLTSGREFGDLDNGGKAAEEAKKSNGDVCCGGSGNCGSREDPNGGLAAAVPDLSRTLDGDIIESRTLKSCEVEQQGGDGEEDNYHSVCTKPKPQACKICPEGPNGTGTCKEAHHHQHFLATSEAAVGPLPPIWLSPADPPGKVLFGSQSGRSKLIATGLATKASNAGISLQIVDAQDYEPEDLVKEKLLVVVSSTWEDGNAPDNIAFFSRWLKESATDFRVGSDYLASLRFAVFGVGSGAYGPERFCSATKDMDRHLAALGARRMLARVDADEDEGTVSSEFDEWSERLVFGLLQGINEGQSNQQQAPSSDITGAGEQSFPPSSQESEQSSRPENDATIAGGDEVEDDGLVVMLSEGEEEDEGKENQQGVNNVVDLEDFAGVVGRKGVGEAGKGRAKKGFVRKGELISKRVKEASVEIAKRAVPSDGPSEMVTPVLRASLEKQGYKIVGTHSGVKICRWTKSQMRGRGGCYKHSFYGIESHRCMETTPSLACANKCVFCWRHHTNPVGKSWKWKMDDPLAIVEGAIEGHTRMVKQMKGVPGVKPERLEEAMAPRHCALSLVGEPIMYPEINRLVGELHARRISSFLVTNAQFPERIAHLDPVTQLYVSVDAATRESLKAVDRPLFSDFWERFTDSLRALGEKRQRTVYRLTLVKGWNIEELQAYADLVQLGRPDFIEIKGVTYCGTSMASTLTMENVPYHEDVRAFGTALCKAVGEGEEYEPACEHVHSCCILLARPDRFKIDGRWHTWIDYDRFHDLVAAGQPFQSQDYMVETPEWAVWDASEGGFDPGEVRFKKERRHGTNSIAA